MELVYIPGLKNRGAKAHVGSTPTTLTLALWWK